MAGTFKRLAGPAFLANAVANIYTPAASTIYAIIRHMEDGKLEINDEWQVKLSQFFYLLDMGFIEIRVDMKSRKKTWARATPSAPPCKESRPRVDFLAAKLKFD